MFSQSYLFTAEGTDALVSNRPLQPNKLNTHMQKAQQHTLLPFDEFRTEKFHRKENVEMFQRANEFLAAYSLCLTK
jgi:hypothetical protein